MGGIVGFLDRNDERALLVLVACRRSTVDRLMGMVTHLGDAWFVISISLLLATGMVPGWQEAGRTAAMALVGSHLGVQLLKRTIDRPRPRLPVGTALLLEPPDRFSFPSGHAAASLSVGLPIAGALPPEVGGMVIAVALLVGLSRCYLGVHYPGDVLMGWLLAAGAVWLG